MDENKGRPEKATAPPTEAVYTGLYAEDVRARRDK